MRTIRYVRELGFPPDVVAGFLGDLRNDPTWRREVLTTELTNGTPSESGSEYRETLSWEGMHADACLEVTEADGESVLTIVGSDAGYESVNEYQFEPTATGTKLTLSLSLQTHGTLQLMEPFMWAMVTRWLERDLDALPSVLDKNGVGSPAQG